MCGCRGYAGDNDRGTIQSSLTNKKRDRSKKTVPLLIGQYRSSPSFAPGLRGKNRFEHKAGVNYYTAKQVAWPGENTHGI